MLHTAAPLTALHNKNLHEKLFMCLVPDSQECDQPQHRAVCSGPCHIASADRPVPHALWHCLHVVTSMTGPGSTKHQAGSWQHATDAWEHNRLAEDNVFNTKDSFL